MKFRIFPCFWVADGMCVCPAGPACRSPGKHPLTPNGVKDATDDLEQLATWRDRWPKANWAIATGNGLVVVDLDIKPGKNGVQSLAKLGQVSHTRTVRTGGGGLHLYFRGDGSNSSGKLGPGIDVRGTGGYVMAPGSSHQSGRTYELLRDVEPVPADGWLVDALGTPRAETQTRGESHTERGYFPPVSEAVLQAARDALDAHGPAIEGEGGNTHTLAACALLTHDFALTDDEARPLLTEWNETCEPPWSDEELETLLQNGAKYGKHAYGHRRTMDAVEVAQKWIKDWTGQGESEMFAMIARVRTLTFDDHSKRAVIERDLAQATGLKAKALALPKAVPPVNRPVGSIDVTPSLHEVADQAIKAINEGVEVFQRNGVLCEVARSDPRTFISDLEPARIIDLMSRTAKYVRPSDGEGGMTVQAPPDKVAAILHARRTHAKVKVLEAITTAPVFLADGSILQERGYSRQGRVYLEPSVTVDVPSEPTRDDARQAVAQFAELLQDFKFQSPADFSSWLAALLSPLVKSATGNAPAPLVCISASSAGSGKSLLAELIARIVTGLPAENRTYSTRDLNEWSKRLTAYVKAASPVSVFDDVNGEIGDEGLNRLITSSVWSDRQLGASEAPPLPNVTTWLATGNNIEPVRDTVRRVLMVRIEVDVERPQERTGFKQPLLAEYAQAQRAELLKAALTLLRAFHVAGRPSQGLPAWGSFVAWSDLVRGALVWAGCADPFLTQQRAAAQLNEPELEAHDFWIGVVESTDGTPAAVCAAAGDRDATTVLGVREAIAPFTLRRFLGRFVDKPRGGKRIRREGQRYVVTAV